VRTTKVESRQSGGTIEVVKTSTSKIPGAKHHRLKLTFKDNKLVNWEPLKEKEEAENLIDINALSSLPEIPKVSMTTASKSGLSIHPKISMISESWELFDDWGGWNGVYDTSGKALRIGVSIGKPMLGMNVGLDISLGSGSGFMLFADKEMFGFHWIASFGKDKYTYEPGNGGSYDAESSFKLGIFKDLKLPISIGIETMGRTSSWYNYDLGSATFFTVKYKLRN